MKKNLPGKGQQNLRAYEGVEDLSTFTSQDAIEQYRQERKDFSSNAVSFLRKKMKNKKPMSVLDIGSGSSCFLYALHDEGALAYGTGIEISKTRHAFAEQWKRDGKYASVDNINQDVRTVSLDSKKFDACTILDSTFTFFHSVAAQLPDQVLRRAYQVLNKDGWLIIDMSSFLDAKRLCKGSGIYYQWKELPETNKFSYSLYKLNCSFKDDMVCTESRYIYRDKVGDFKKIEHSRMYTAPELEKMVRKAGFKKTSIYSGYDGKPFNPRSSSRILLASQK